MTKATTLLPHQTTTHSRPRHPTAQAQFTHRLWKLSQFNIHGNNRTDPITFSRNSNSNSNHPRLNRSNIHGNNRTHPTTTSTTSINQITPSQQRHPQCTANLIRLQLESSKPKNP